MTKKNLHRDTLAIHAGHVVDTDTNSRAVPLYQTSAFTFNSPEHAASLFELKTPGNIYTRLMNPTTDILEKRIAAMDGGVAALALASGQSAIFLTLMNLMKQGQNFVTSPAVYGGTSSLFNNTLSRLGIETRWTELDSAEKIEAAIDENTRFIYCESIGNPKNEVLDFEMIAEVAHRHGLPLVMDNTVSPYGFRPFEHGVDITIYSLTKYICGHGTSMGGIIVDSGKFDWTGKKYGFPNKFPEFTGPDPAYHGLIFYDHFGGDSVKDETGTVINPAFIARARCCLLRDWGPAISPFNSWLTLQGLETLPLRWPRICETAQKIATWLEAHPEVAWVNYPGLKSSKSYRNLQKYMNGNGGGIIGFGIRGGMEAGKKLIQAVKLFSHVTNIGDVHSLISHPASTTHQQLSEEEQLASGVTPDFLRLSIGLENAEDLIADLSQAISSCRQ
ncbi:MAG: PLP-dependent transferase [Planctomycetia bacterium]|nr:PLP-dependent transferase [Planctomycetia bacterium]